MSCSSVDLVTLGKQKLKDTSQVSSKFSPQKKTR